MSKTLIRLIAKELWEIESEDWGGGFTWEEAVAMNHELVPDYLDDATRILAVVDAYRESEVVH